MNLSRSATRTFTDPDQAASALPSGAARYKVLGRGVFHAETTVVALDRLTLQCGKERLARVVYHALHPDKVAFLAWPRGPLPVVRGTPMRSGDLMSLGRETESYHRTDGSVDYVALLVDASELERASLEFAGRELPIGSGRVLRPSEHSLARLQSLLDDAGRVARGSPEVFAANEACRALEQAITVALVACLEDAAASRDPATHAQRARIMSRFEQVTEANADRPLHVPELCKLVGVPERTLRKCCQQHLGMSPHQYLLRRRVFLARRALLRGDPDAATVTSIATRHGFWELGRFSALYRAMFGEVPSATLRRSA
jgi:AraC-like DNA-binding protein